MTATFPRAITMSSLKRRTLLLGSLTAAALPAPALMAQGLITLDVQFPFPGGNNKEIHQGIADRFMKANPDIRITFRNPAQQYEDASQQILRASLVNQMPDLSFQGLNLLRVLVDKELARPLATFIARDGGADALGYAPAVMDTVRQRGDIYGVPFFISTPVIYLNETLLREAGGNIETFPHDWPEIVALGKRIGDKAQNRTGFYFQWDVTGNWMWQALLFGRGGRILSDDERRVAFDGPEGLWALEQFEQFAHAGMPNLRQAQSRPAFAAGTLGIHADSSSNIAFAEKQAGDKFKMRVLPFPLGAPNGRVPAGGALGVIHAADPRRQEAAWRYLRFCTNPESQAFMVRLTGYMPSNTRAIADPELLGRFYQENPNQKASVDQLGRMTGWYAFPGANAVRIIDTVRNHTESVVTGRRTARAVLPDMANDVRRLLPSA
jgi:multiple sugar transport system substrate-binding protein